MIRKRMQFNCRQNRKAPKSSKSTTHQFRLHFTAQHLTIPIVKNLDFIQNSHRKLSKKNQLSKKSTDIYTQYNSASLYYCQVNTGRRRIEKLIDYNNYRSAICDSLRQIDLQLANMSHHKKRPLDMDDKENVPPYVRGNNPINGGGITHVPRSEWIYQTPPNRKFISRFIDGSTSNNGTTNYEPAILATVADKKIVYGLTHRFDTNTILTNEHVDLDARYMNEIARFTIDGIACCSNTSTTATSVCDNTLNTTDGNDVDSHFIGLTARPKRKLSKISRATTMRPKRHNFDATSGNTSMQLTPASPKMLTSSSSTPSSRSNTPSIRMTPETPERSYRFRFHTNNDHTTNCTFYDYGGRSTESFDFFSG